MKKFIKGLLTLSILGTVSPLVVNAEGNFPIVDEKVTLHYWVGKGPQNYHVDWNDNYEFWDNYEELTNVHIEWTQVSSEAKEEQRNLTLVSGDYPDVFYSADFGNADILRYGQQGVFLPLNDLIKEHAPNLQKIIDENPEVKAAITFPDGNIYSMPVLMDKNHVSARAGATPWVNKDLLEKAGFETLETTDDLYNYLTYVKENEPDKVPFGAPGIDYFYSYLSGSFGVMNRGAANGYVDIDNETNQLRFYATTDEYKEMLQYLNKLYTEGLIDQSIFTMEWNQYVANQDTDTYSMFLFWGPDKSKVDDFASKYTHATALEGPHGDRQYTPYTPMLTSNGQYILTNANEHPEVAVAWVDYFYSKEGSLLFNTGVEGVTFEYVDGEIQRTMDNEDIPYYLPSLGNNQGIFYKDTTETTPFIEDAMVDFVPYIEEPWAPFTYTEEENEFIITVAADIDKYVEEMRDLFVSGQASFDQWDDYINTLEGMGIDEYVQVKQTAYDRVN